VIASAVVTGGAGFVGSNLVDRLVRGGTRVLVLDDLSSGSVRNLRGALAVGARLEQVDVRDGARLREALAAFRPEVVFHLAAQIDVRASMSDPAADASVNVLGSVNVLAAALAGGARRVVNTSTGGAMYGAAVVIPTPETEPTAPLSAYGMSKRTAEEYGAWFRNAHGLDVVTLRYSNVYGPRQNPGGDAGVVAILCDRVLAGRPPLVFGDGRQTRDYVFVGDVVSANVAAARAPALRHAVSNIGTGTEVSVLELIAAVARAAGVPADSFSPEFRPARPGEVERSCLDVTLARAELALPPLTPLAQGLATTLEWVRWAARQREHAR
jgi:UDP-glucose 4-epimerase